MAFRCDIISLCKIFKIVEGGIDLKFKGKNIIRKVITTLIVVMLMGSSIAFGVGYNRQITAWFYNIQVKLNGGPLNFSKEPFIYNGSVYIALRDVSENLGLEVTWDDTTKTVYLANNGTYTNTNTYNTPSNYNSQYVLIDKKSVNEVEDELNYDYDEYTDGRDDLEFNYDLSEESSYIKVKMEGENFKRDSRDWEDRGEDDFQDFVEDIAELVADELDDDVKIYSYDRSSKTVGKYEYDKRESDFKVSSEYGEEVDIDDLEDDLNDDYDKYDDDNEDLEFEYNLREQSSYIKVEMDGDFDRDHSDWKDRDEDDFQDFIEDIVDMICDEIDDMDIYIYIYDENNDKTAEYKYDEDDDDLDVDEYDDDNDEIDTIEDDLNDDYEVYDDDNEDLEFKYSLTKGSSYIKVEMKGQNFDKDHSDWEDRDEDDFRDFVENVAEEVYDEIDNKDVRIYVVDKNGDDTAEYKYDEDDDDFEVIDEKN